MIDAMANTFLYFAYGSNMLTRRLTARTPSAEVVGSAFVEGHRLTFDKVSSDGSGKCDIEPTGNAADRVYGVLFTIAAAEAGDLDEAEGHHGYRKGKVQVVISEGTSTAVAYSATDKHPSRPFHWYKNFVIAGAVEHALPTGYIDWLKTIPSQPDLNAARRARNEALLSGTV